MLKNDIVTALFYSYCFYLLIIQRYFYLCTVHLWKQSLGVFVGFSQQLTGTCGWFLFGDTFSGGYWLQHRAFYHQTTVSCSFLFFVFWIAD